jgi:hypothetical protein
MYSKALLASGLVALVLTVSLQFVSSGGRVYLSAVDWGQVNSMNYQEGQAYLAERSKEITRWESLHNGLRYSEFWLSAFANWLLYSAVGFASCIVFRQLPQSKRSLKSGPRERPPAP